jgi:hypothetical protein
MDKATIEMAEDYLKNRSKIQHSERRPLTPPQSLNPRTQGLFDPATEVVP